MHITVYIYRYVCVYIYFSRFSSRYYITIKFKKEGEKERIEIVISKQNITDGLDTNNVISP